MHKVSEKLQKNTYCGIYDSFAPSLKTPIISIEFSYETNDHGYQAHRHFSTYW